MAASYMLRPIHASSNFLCPPPPPSSQHADRPLIHVPRRRAFNNRHYFSSLRCMRDRTSWVDFSSKLPACSSSSHCVLVLPYGKFVGRISAVFDAGTQVSTAVNTPSSVSFNGSNFSGNPNSDADAKPEFPPEDFDYEIYASMTMDCFVPPPPPRIPFGGPFEDYYDVIVGEDYIPKQEKPTSSFLMFLETLNKKRMDDPQETEKPKDMPGLFNRNEPLIPQTRVPRSSSSGVNVRNEPLIPQTRGPQSSSSAVNQTSSSRQQLSPQTRPLEPSVRSSPTTSTYTTQNSSFSDSSRSLSTPTSTASPKQAPDNRVLTPSTRSSGEIPVQDNQILTPSTRSSGEIPQRDNRILTPSTRSSGEIPEPDNQILTPSTRSSGEIPERGNQILTPSTRSSGEFPQRDNLVLTPSTRSSGEIPARSSNSGKVSSPATSSYLDSRDQLTRSDGRISSAYHSHSEPEAPSIVDRTLSAHQETPGRLSRPVSPDNAVYLSLLARGESLPVPLIMDSSVPPTRPVEKDSDNPVSTESIVPVSYPVDQVHDSRGSSQARPVKDDRSLIPETRSQMEDMPVKEAINNSPFMPSEVVPTQGSGVTSRSSYPQTRQSTGAQFEQVDEINGSSTEYPQTLPVVAGGQSQTEQQPASVIDVLEKTQLSQFYEPTVGDMVVGAVVYADNQQLELEIGAELPALMALRDFEPLPQIVDSRFCKLPLDGILPASGQSFIVDNRTANDSTYHGAVEIGTVVVAEVQARAVIDGRAILHVRQLAERLAWDRVGQIMEKGEVIQLEIEQYNEGGLLGYLEGIRAFLPRSELLQRPESSAALRDYVGQTLSVAVVEANKRDKNCIISEARVWKSKNLLLGSVHNLTVTRVYGYGLQVEIDNTRIRGFLHISNISKEYVSAVGNYFAEGDKVRAMLIKGRNPDQVSFSTADLEIEKGQMLRNKQEVYERADEVAKSFFEGIPMEEREHFKLSGRTTVDLEEVRIANLQWLDKTTSLKSL